MADTKLVCPVCEEKKKPSTGLDVYGGGDGLPDWMQFTITAGMFGILYWVLSLLFHPILELDPNHRDLLNIILGTFIATFGKTIDFWFKHDKSKKSNDTIS
jgi:hypothetical protein